MTTNNSEIASFSVLPSSEKINYIISAIENGWSVKKISEKDYQFSKKTNLKDNCHTRVCSKRINSVPVTKKDHNAIV